MRLSKSLCAIFLIALVARLGAQLILRAYVQPETWEYEAIANNLLAGRGYSYETGGITYISAVSSPLYVLLTAGIYAVTGHSYAVILALQALCGACTAVLAGWLGQRTFGGAAVWFAGLLTALDPALAVYAAKLHPLTFDALAFLGVVCACVGLPRYPGAGRLLGIGVLLGVAALTRTTVLSLVPLLLIWLNRFRSVRLLSWPALALVVAAVLVYAPWPVRNSLLLGQFVPGSSESTEWLWRGTNANATGGSLTLDGRTMLEVAPAEFRAQIANASESERYSIYRAAAIDFARAQPTQALGLFGTKLAAFWWGSDASGQLYPATWRVVYGVWLGAVLVLALGGAVVGWRLPEARGPLVLIVGSLVLVAVTQALFYVEGRHRFAVEPLLLVLSGGGLCRLAGRVHVPAWSSRGVSRVAKSSS